MVKLKVLLVISVFVLFIKPSFAFDRWTTGDKVLQLTYATLHVMDWGQTRYIAKNPETSAEINLFLGRHPSIGKVNTYFVITLIGHTSVTHFLPQEYRKYWQIFWIWMEGGSVYRNWYGGIKITF